MGSEKFCLRWNDFERNISEAFRELRDDKDFFDVTLACDDEQIQAHKVILSACSPFFRNVLRRLSHQHPLLYLKGVKYTDLQSVLNFMYHGEVNVAQEELNSFLAVAEDLKVKGLTQNQSGGDERKSESYTQPTKSIKPTPRPPDREPLPLPKRVRPVPTAPIMSSYPDSHDYDDIQEVVPVKTEPRDPLPPPPAMSQSTPVLPVPQDIYNPPTHALTPADDQLQYQEENYDDYSQYEVDHEQGYEGGGGEGGNKGQFQDPSDLLQFVKESFDGGKRFACSLCNKFAHNGKANVRNHVESVHFPNTFQYPCDQCDNFFPSKNNVQLHRSRMHKGSHTKNVLGHQ